MTLEEATKDISSKLVNLYEPGEANAITDLVLENITGWKKMDRIIHKKDEISSQKKEKFLKISEQLLAGSPVQYVLHEAWFMGMKLYVDENVLIPRPETEELVEWLIDEWRGTNRQKIHVFDVGTGSGCIPIALMKKMHDCDFSACDLSVAALNVAKKNASDQGVKINFFEVDFLDRSKRESLEIFDCIISNPPYIPRVEQDSLEKHVVNYEPHIALFVPDNDPLVFYSAILDFTSNHLKSNGQIFLELHENLGEKVSALFESNDFSEVELRKDLHGKNRMLRVKKN